MASTGLVLWFAARRGRPRIRGNAPAGRADTIVLVGSEGGSTWGFAATLHAALSDAGQAVHAALVRKHPGGLCSSRLIGLEPGDTVCAFLRRNPSFHPGRSRAPLILIGAGTGIGPLAGFVRANSQRRPIHLYFGMRHPDSDFLFGEELACWQREGRLRQLSTACSRGRKPRYVQDALRGEAAEIKRLIGKGARITVCGGRDMAAGVSAALADILAPAGLTPALLKAEGRYVEDVY